MADQTTRTIFETLKQEGIVAPQHPLEGKPYGYTLRSWDRQSCGDLSTWRKLVHLHRSLGYNNISFDIAWADVESEPGCYDWTEYDPYLGAIVEAGLTLQLKMNSRALPKWVKLNRDAMLCGPDGLPVDDGGTTWRPYHGFADDSLIRSLQRFYREVAGHCRGLPNLFYTSAFACAFESEYHAGVWTDYSPAAQRQFRMFLKTRYSSTDQVNAVWGSGYRSWDQVLVAWRPSPIMQGGSPDVRYVDFMKYREWSARRFFDAMHDAIKQGDPEAEYGPQVGRIACQVGMLRGTVSAFHWAENCEWIFVDPAPIDDIAWELAVARAGGKKVAVELDGPYAYRNHGLHAQLPQLYADQTRKCYEHGADYVCHANWTETSDYVRAVAEGLHERAAVAKQGECSASLASEAVFVGKWDSYLREHRGWADQPGQVLEESRKRFQELRSQGKAIDVVLDDTILRQPERLKQYARIHVCGARFMARSAWQALQSCAAELCVSQSENTLRDETGTSLERLTSDRRS